MDPLEIAAGLEAHGITDRAAARFRHRDVFSLAEEMYARVPHVTDAEPELGPDGTGSYAAVAAATDPAAVPATAKGPADPPASESGNRRGWALWALLPGAVCALTVFALQVTEEQAHLAVWVAGVLGAALALLPALGRGPLGGVHRFAPATRMWICWLLAYALAGDGLLRTAVMGGPDRPGPAALAPLLALACAVAPGSWCAYLFDRGAARGLAASRGLREFTARVRPLLLGVVLLFLCALGLLLALSAALLDRDAALFDQDAGSAGALGALLFLARLLLARGFTYAPAAVLAAAGLGEAMALATVFAGRLPGFEPLALPVQRLVEDHGPGPVPALICGAGALVLLVHALRTLARASAHARAGGGW